MMKRTMNSIMRLTDLAEAIVPRMGKTGMWGTQRWQMVVLRRGTLGQAELGRLRSWIGKKSRGWISKMLMMWNRSSSCTNRESC